MSGSHCDVCGGSPATPVVYGYPTRELVESAERGEVILGGCIIEADQPHRLCSRCASSLSDSGDEDPSPSGAPRRSWR